MSFINALLYPLRGKNLWILLGLNLVVDVFFGINFFIALPSPFLFQVVFGWVLMTYCWLCLRNFALGNTNEELPDFDINLIFSKLAKGFGVLVMALGYSFFLGFFALPIFIFIHYDSGIFGRLVCYSTSLLLLLFFYILFGISFIRYVEANWRQASQLTATIRLAFKHWNETFVYLRNSFLMTLFVGASQSIIYFLLQSSIETQAGLLAQNILNMITLSYIMFAYIYLLNDYGKALGFFPIEEQKAEPEFEYAMN